MVTHRLISKVINAGGWANYERLQHLDRLTLMLTPKDDGRRRSRRRLSPLRRLPPGSSEESSHTRATPGYYHRVLVFEFLFSNWPACHAKWSIG